MKPCPFCNEETNIRYQPSHDDCYFQCHTCTVTGPNGSDKESAIWQWNKRPIEESLRAKLVKAEQIIGIVHGMRLWQQLDCELFDAVKEYKETK